VNRAVAEYAAGYRWLIRVDGHCAYPDGYVSKLIETAEMRGATSVVVPMVCEGSGCFQRAAAAAQNSVIGTGGSAHRRIASGRYVDHGHHALMDIAKFVSAGGYCEAMERNEDAELDYRINKKLGRIWLEPELAIRYFPRRSPWALSRQYFQHGEGRARNVRRHGMPLKLRQIIPLATPCTAALMPLAVLHPLFGLPALAWALMTLAAGIFIGLRAGGGCALGAGIAALIMHISWGTGFLCEWFRRNPPAPRHGFVYGRPRSRDPELEDQFGAQAIGGNNDRPDPVRAEGKLARLQSQATDGKNIGLDC
jgi:succinoglycan biosynthesis protein ExoA